MTNTAMPTEGDKDFRPNLPPGSPPVPPRALGNLPAVPTDSTPDPGRHSGMDPAASALIPTEVLNERLLTIRGLPESVKMTTYPRDEVEGRHVHFGPGKFCRSFVAPLSDEYMQKLYDEGNPDWKNHGIVVISTKNDHRYFQEQDYLYTLNLKDPKGGEEFRVVRSIHDYLFSQESAQQEKAMRLLLEPTTTLVSLTITPNGYSDLNGDLQDPTWPTSPVGMIARALDKRRELGIEPFVVLSCDNMPPNGSQAKAALKEYSYLIGRPDLADHMDTVRFPNTCVDRITPTPDLKMLSHVSSAIQAADKGAVVSETWRRLVIQTVNRRGDPTFKGPVPWDGLPGVIASENAEPIAKMKGHLVNTSHMVIAWLGTRMGAQEVADVLESSIMKQFLRRVLDEEIRPFTPQCDGINLHQEIRTVVDRLSNRHVPDQIARLNTKGSTKIPERVVGIIADGLAQGKKMDGLCLTVASWISCYFDNNELGHKISVNDESPLFKQQVEEIKKHHKSPIHALPAFLELCGDGIKHNPEFLTSLNKALFRFKAGKTINDIAYEYIRGIY